MNDKAISAELHHFFAAYFHQDWDLEADNWQGIVDGYVNDEKPAAELLRSMADEVDTLRVAGTEPDLKQLMVYTIGVYYSPEPLPYTVWLGQIGDRLRQHAAAIENGSGS